MFKNSSITKKISLFLVVALAFSFFAYCTTKADAYTGTVTGVLTNSRSTTDPCYIDSTGKNASIRVCTFDRNGKRTSGALNARIEGLSSKGRWVYLTTTSINGYNGSSATKSNLKFPNGYSRYRVFIYRNGTNSSNVSKTYYGSIDCGNNTWWHR